MTEENNQASSDDAAEKAAKKKGAIRGGLVGLGLVLLTAAVGVAIGITEWNAALLVFAVLLTVMGATLGWNLPGAIVREDEREARKPIPWKRSAAIGALVGMVPIIYIYVLPAVATLGVMSIPKGALMAALISLTLFAPAGAFLFAIVHVVLLNPPARRKKTFKFLGWTAGVLAGLVAIVVVINIPDEDLLPEAKKVLESRGFTVKESENGFFHLAGMNAPSGENPHAFGVKRVARWESESRKSMSERDKFNESALYGGKALKAQMPRKELAGLCDWFGKERPGMASCLEARGRDVVTRFLAENPLWIERYLGLLQYPRFEEYIDVAYIEGASPQYEMVHGMSVVRKAQCAVLVGEGKGHDCLLILAEDVRMARRMLDGARSLAGKIAAEKLLRVDYQFLAELVAARPDAARQHAALINEMLAPLTAQEQDMSKVLMERVYFGKTFHKDILRESAFGAFLYKGNVEINRMYRQCAEDAQIAKLPASQYQAAREAQLAKPYENQQVNWTWVYNPFGKLLSASVSMSNYVSIIHNLDGQQRLVRLQWKIVEQQVPADKVGDFIAAAGAEYHDPYTNKPMAWDAQKRTLSCVCGIKERTARYEARL